MDATLVVIAFVILAAVQIGHTHAVNSLYKRLGELELKIRKLELDVNTISELSEPKRELP